jgi:APA family basic amino acid/polyamine antiporter
VATLYILIQLVCVGTLPELAQSTKPLADAGTRFLGTAGGTIISAGAIISITGNLNILLLSGSRIPYAMAEQKELPSIAGKLHKQFATPYVSILLTAGIMLFMTLKGSFVAAVTISAIARLRTYAATCLSLFVFRRRSDAPKAQFHLLGGPVIAGLCLILIVWLLANSKLEQAATAEVITAAIVAVSGLVVFLAYRFYSRPS